METIVKKLYEAMFLVDSVLAASDWDGINAAIEKILERAEVEIISTRKWDERRLAYEIKGKSRGTYILCYFRADGEKIQQIERDVQLSEQIMRVLILSAEHMSGEDIERDTSAVRGEEEVQQAALETDAGSTEPEVSEEARSQEGAKADTMESVTDSDESEQAVAEFGSQKEIEVDTTEPAAEAEDSSELERKE